VSDFGFHESQYLSSSVRLGSGEMQIRCQALGRRQGWVYLWLLSSAFIADISLKVPLGILTLDAQRRRQICEIEQ
jgi:hypothetical protein